MIRPNDTKPSRLRRFADQGHQPPASRVDKTGAPWLGTSRVIDRAARRRSQQRSWKAGLAADRDEVVAAQELDRDGAS